MHNLEVLPSNPWKAGFADGDGLFTILERVRTDRPSIQFFPAITFGLTDPVPLRLLSKEYGGGLYRKKGRAHWAPQWYWRCPQSSCERFLRDVLPYLRIKRSQALILLELLGRMHHPLKKRRIGRGGSAPLTKEELSVRKGLRDNIRTLNTKGSYSRRVLRKRNPGAVDTLLLESENRQFSPLTDPEVLEWMAGFFDAEGSISIEMQIRKGRPSPRFTLQLGVSNSDVNGLYPFVTIYGGRIYLHEETRLDVLGKKWSNMYRWQCPQGSALKLIEDISSNLVIKRPQAGLGKRFLEHLSKAPSIDRNKDGTFGTLTDDEIATRTRYREQMLRLNNTPFENSKRRGGGYWPL
jgi:hypothetical protein